MSTMTLTDRDVQLRERVVRQLDWDPEVDAGGIGVTAKDGVVTLTGFIGTCAGKLAAERTAKRVKGVRAVANDLEVSLKAGRTDADIARDLVHALELHVAIPASVQAAVHDGHVTLTGKVEWLYQSREAERVARHVKGVRGVFNHIEIAGGAVMHDVRDRIVEALHRSADVDARRIGITVAGDTATLTGTVTTWGQRNAAERAAAGAAGITRVRNEILVEPIEPMDEIC